MTKNQIREYITDLCVIADILERHPEVKSPRFGMDRDDNLTVSFSYWDNNAAAKIAEGIKLFLGVKFVKNNPNNSNYDSAYYELKGKLSACTVRFVSERGTVCKRVVTATETVTEELPDPALVAKLPTVKTERVIETVEWQCVPLLAKAEAVAS